MAFTHATTLPSHQLAHPSPRCTAQFSRQKRPVSPRTTRCSYATDLQTRTGSVSQSSTDSLVSSVTQLLDNGFQIPQSTLEEMVVHLADTRGMSRLALVELFGRIGQSATNALLQGLSDCPSPVVRRSCGKALAQVRDARAIPALLKSLTTDPDTVARASAAGALARIGVPAVEGLLQLIGESEDMTAKGHAAWALAYMQGDAAQVLLDKVRDESSDVRLAVVGALGSVLLGDALPAMRDANVDDWNPQEAPGGVREKAERALLEALKDDEAVVRAEAVTAIANAGKKEYAAEIAKVLKDQDRETRRAAALGLMKIGDRQVVSALRERIDDEQEEECVTSVAKLAVSAIERATEEEDLGW